MSRHVRKEERERAAAQRPAFGDIWCNLEIDNSPQRSPRPRRRRQSRTRWPTSTCLEAIIHALENRADRLSSEKDEDQVDAEARAAMEQREEQLYAHIFRIRDFMRANPVDGEDDWLVCNLEELVEQYIERGLPIDSPIEQLASFAGESPTQHLTGLAPKPTYSIDSWLQERATEAIRQSRLPIQRLAPTPDQTENKSSEQPSARRYEALLVECQATPADSYHSPYDWGDASDPDDEPRRKQWLADKEEMWCKEIHKVKAEQKGAGSAEAWMAAHPTFAVPHETKSTYAGPSDIPTPKQSDPMPRFSNILQQPSADQDYPQITRRDSAVSVLEGAPRGEQIQPRFMAAIRAQVRASFMDTGHLLETELRCTCPNGLHAQPSDPDSRACHLVPYGVCDTFRDVHVGYDQVTETEAFAAWLRLGHTGSKPPYYLNIALNEELDNLLGLDSADALVECHRWKRYLRSMGYNR